MPLELDDERIVLFKNDKEGNDKRPDYRGELKTPDGKQFEVSLWISEAKSGSKYLSGKVQKPYGGNGSSGDTTKDEDEIPFARPEPRDFFGERERGR